MKTFEVELFEFGYPGSITLRRATAEKAAEQKLGTQRILNNTLVVITSVRLEDDTPDGMKGRVIATCQPVASLKELQPRSYSPPGMETK